MKTWIRRLLVIQTVGGGTIGVATAFGIVLQAEAHLATYVITAGIAALFSFAVWAGLRFIEDEKKGLQLLQWYLITQIPILSSPYLVYDLCSGLSAKLSCSGSNFGITAFFGTQLQFFIGTQRPWGVGLNLVAIALLILVRKQMKTEPNQTPEPTPTAVTPPAGQESRQP